MRSRYRAASAVLAASATLASGCAFQSSHEALPPPRAVNTYPLHNASTSGLQYPPTPGAAHRRGRPNILMITVDDASGGDLTYMPNVEHLLAADGVTLANAIAPSPICVPARASLLTGQYAHNHGARTISGPHGGFASFDDRNTLPVWLQRAGYSTAFVGKYLNGYGDGNPPTYVPPGWSQWHATTDPSTYDFMRPQMNDNGHLTDHHRYNTFLIRDRVDALLRRDSHQKKPWYMWVNYVAPHSGGPHQPDDPPDFKTTYPAPQDQGSFDWLPAPDTPDMYRWGRRSKAMYTTDQRGELRQLYQQRIESLQAVDRAIAQHVALLKKTGQWRNTLVILTSDNGFAVGQHGIVGKLWFFREISNIPVVIRGPGVPRGKTLETLVSNPDIAATIAAVAHAEPTGRRVDGSNVFRLLSRPTVRRVVALEAWRTRDGDSEIYSGLRYGGRWTYYRYADGSHEGLYDHKHDPFEMHNLATSPEPSIQRLLRKLRRIDRTYAACRGAVCRRLSRG